MAGRCGYSKLLMRKHFGEEKRKTRGDKRMVKLEFLFQNHSLWEYIKKTNTFTFWCMVIPLGPYDLVYIK
jgi:hypothetical protein